MNSKVKVPVIVLTVLSMIGAVASAVGAGIPEAVPVTTAIVAIVGGVVGALLPAETPDGEAPVLQVAVPGQVIALLTVGVALLGVFGGEIPAIVPFTAVGAGVIQRLLGYMVPTTS